MPINNRCLFASTIAVAALFAATGVRANPAQLPNDHALFHGAGFGTLSAVPAPRSKGSSAVFAALDLHGPWAEQGSIGDTPEGGSAVFDLDAIQADKALTVGASESSPVTAVPEPDTYALLLAGLAAVGFMARRQSR